MKIITLAILLAGVCALSACADTKAAVAAQHEHAADFARAVQPLHQAEGQRRAALQ